MSELPVWLEPALSYIRSWLSYQMRLTETPGCCVAIAHDGAIVLEAAFGVADLRTREALTAQHRFRVASHSKTFTAAGIMRLRERGHLKLDDAVGQFVTGLHSDIANATVGQLISHATGASRDSADWDYWSGRSPFPDASRIRRDFTAKPPIEVGSRLKYSNHGFALAGLVIEAIVGEPFATWIQREIVEAAGLVNTTPDISPLSASKLSSGHSGRVLLGRRLAFAVDQPVHALAPAAGFVSTAGDLASFFSQLSPTGDSNLLSCSSRREMTRAHWRDPYSSVEYQYGLGTACGSHKDWEWFGHGGGFLGQITRTVAVPSRHLAVSILTNAQDGKAQAWVEAALNILHAFFSAVPAARPSSDWRGRWWNVWGTQDLVAIGNKLLLASPDLTDPFLKVPELTIVANDEARITQASAFHHYGERVRLLRGAHGEVVALDMAGDLWVPEERLAQELIDRYGS